MDLREVEIQAQQILAAAVRFGSPVDADTIITVAYNNDQTWRNDDRRVRLATRAVELLRGLRFLEATQGGFGLEISPIGRRVLDSNWPVELGHESWFAEWIETQELLESLDAQRVVSSNSISELVVRDWRQFSDVDIIFHPKVTVLTGANGAGKTTLLNILSPHFNWSAQLLLRQRDDQAISTPLEVGHLRYSNGARTTIVQQPGSGIRNSPLTLLQMQQVPGIFINSHRSISSYQPLSALPPRFSEWDVLQQEFAAEIQVRYSGGASQHSPLHRMKEALVAAAMYAYGNLAVRPSDPAREVWEGYQEVLTRFLPESLGFRRLDVEDSEIVLVCDNAEFPLEAVSGGISAMLELSWQIFLRQRNQDSFTVCIDEPENHLHPELQRTIVPSLLRGFPNVTFIVATHSPLVVTATPEAFVYSLSADEDGRISSHRVDSLNASGTSDETLMSVLGLDTALPLWAETQLSDLLSQLGETPTINELRTFRDELRRLGLDRQFPAAVRSLGLPDDD